MSNKVCQLSMDELVDHPDNANQMSKANFTRLLGNIERSGRYEPIVVRPHPQQQGKFQIINGHHRRRALAKLGYEKADAVVWNVDDEETDILLSTLNRLTGRDILDKKIKILKRLSARRQATDLSKILPQKAKQIERLTNLKGPTLPARQQSETMATAMVFFVSSQDKALVSKALESAADEHADTKAAANASGLVEMARHYLKNIHNDEESSDLPDNAG